MYFGFFFKFYLMELLSSLEFVRLVEGGGGKEGMFDFDLVVVFVVIFVGFGIGFLKKNFRRGNSYNYYKSESNFIEMEIDSF